MNIAHLKLFTRIAATHNISLAGKELGLSAAVASAHINKLEETLGTQLLYRTTRKVSLTEEGFAFLPHAESVLDSVESARAAIGAGSHTPQGTLRVTAPASFGRMHIVPALVEFTQLYPELHIDLRLSDSIVDMVEGGFDVAIRNAALSDSTLVARKLASDTRILCASPDYIEQHGIPANIDELKTHPIINLTGIEHWVFANNQGTIKFKPASKLHIDNGEAIRDACMRGMGITLCSMWCAYQALQEGKLVQVLKDQPLINDTALWAVYPSSRLLAPKVRVFIDYLKAYIGDVPYWD
ncbi:MULTISPECIES: LysR family transcriptional regulator [Pseudoalteromonas]|uniref:LysR family transcriptional regulator n=1 Tax=Pseudoalteromonas obscura TaxID=3048491 RepID=A0ABT7ERP3_9GAMM|nr:MULTISPECIES: LysR family transcriptional regulator [Pseudoalteromonas]MBQ4838980.1 LysR family transcriptional regulator [Pseudoalteromonas luteoviolacea]MDK2597717.1 LysR family transcriptional regulator [Pseudoalteromonas sp. P94(2023)]